MAATPLSKDEQKLVTEWKKSGLLEPVDFLELREFTEGGFIWAGCGDGNHFLDAIDFYLKKVGCSTLMQPGGWVGGSVRLDPTLDISAKYAQPSQCLEELRLIRRRNGFTALLVEAHGVCGFCRDENISLQQGLESTLRSARFVVDALDWHEDRILRMFRVYREDGERATYRVNPKNFRGEV